MTDEQTVDQRRKALERQWDMVNTPGWADMEAEYSDKVENIKQALLNPNMDNESTYFARGMAHAYQEIVSRRIATEVAMNELDETDEALDV